MSAHKDIPALLEQWRQLSQAEASAIQSAAWPRVNQIQAEKNALRRDIAVVMPGASEAQPFRAQIAQLISLEARNAELLAAQLRRAQASQQMIDQTGQNLRKIKRSYIRRNYSEWQCYS